MIGCEHNPEICNCSCHQTGAVHVVPCCVTCHGCWKKIKQVYYDSHKNQCGVDGL